MMIDGMIDESAAKLDALLALSTSESTRASGEIAESAALQLEQGS